MGKLLSIVFFLVIPGLSLAWDEPDNFRGLKFGEDITKALPECPLPKYNRQTLRFEESYPGEVNQMLEKWKVFKLPCWVQNKYLYPGQSAGGGDDDYTIKNLGPVGNINTTTYARQLDSKLAFVGVVFPTMAFDDMMAILKERYDRPSTRAVKEWQSKAGAKFDNVVVSWVGKRISIIMEARGGERDNAILMYMTESWLAKMSKEKEDVVKKGAKDL